jgi:hypothetical protein
MALAPKSIFAKMRFVILARVLHACHHTQAAVRQLIVSEQARALSAEILHFTGSNHSTTMQYYGWIHLKKDIQPSQDGGAED